MACRSGRLCHYSINRRFRAGLGVPMPTCRRAIAHGEGLEAGRSSDATLARCPAPYRRRDHAAAPAAQPPIACLARPGWPHPTPIPTRRSGPWLAAPGQAPNTMVQPVDALPAPWGLHPLL